MSDIKNKDKEIRRLQNRIKELEKSATASKKAEEKLKESKRYNFLLDSLTDGILL